MSPESDPPAGLTAESVAAAHVPEPAFAWNDAPAVEVPGTNPPGAGVPLAAPSAPRVTPLHKGVTLGGVLGGLSLLLGCFGLLGEGERCLVDARFATPAATLRTYWDGMRRGDADIVWACFTEGRFDLPVPGQLWFLPPTERLDITQLRTLPVDPNRVMVTYEVDYVPRGLSELRSFRTGDELVKVRGEWRISRPIGDASTPDPEPIPRPVDS